MILSSFLAGIGIGLVVAAPVGPAAVMVIGRSLDRGWRVGFVTGLGVVLADLVYAGIAVAGLGWIEQIYAFERPLQLFAGLLLLIMGLVTATGALSRDGGQITALPNPTYHGRNRVIAACSGCIATFALTIVNPTAVAAFLALFATLGRFAEDKIPLLGGIAAGGALWWAGLAWGAAHAGRKLAPRWPMRIKRGAGAVLAAIGAGVLVYTGIDYWS
ncbi:MAG: hypothetical protein CMO30_09225 [Tistrella sp.]|jgi:threonine/homoserine/homoserine lactone efflux protein|uniref:Lysine transporter LysE n=1 Tax=Tistrella mobilis TaxID=171437 RepID=A0A161Q5R0_9PROT|nr:MULTISPECIES: LysE family transporter [Tistrella]KYO54358.1 hypothetical protein AUP44_03395 [Tistrella mobilis]MAD38118.1 hypothetical protein [Tistrella sp.]MBA75447.1 hypothetical protein [Tistrella sp.]HAE46357.1 hypothetical protein [Tistrella mobilis]